MTGRPSSFTQEIADEICEALATTPRGLDFICASNVKFPNAATVHRWLGDKANAAFRESYLRARERQADLLFDECLEIADDSSQDVKIVGEDEREVLNGEFVARAKLRIDTRMRMAGKLKPKVYGEKVTVAGDADNPLRTETRVDVSGLTPEQLRALASVRLPTDA